MTGVFPSVKIVKVVLIFKKSSKLDYSNFIDYYPPISLLSNIEKILEKLMY